MARLRSALALGLALALLAPTGANAQAAKGKAPPVPSKAVIDRAAENFRILISGLQSDKVPQPVKNVLFACIYSNPFSKISEGTDKVMIEKKADRSNPSMVIGAMAAICGYRPGEMGATPKK